MVHATYYRTDWGLAQIRPSIVKSFENLSDRELVEKAFLNNRPDPEYMAEVEIRGLGNAFSTEEELMKKVELRESLTTPAASSHFKENDKRFSVSF